MVSDICGDALTFYILTENKNMILTSVVCPYNSDENPNIYLDKKEEKKLWML